MQIIIIAKCLKGPFKNCIHLPKNIGDYTSTIYSTEEEAKKAVLEMFNQYIDNYEFIFLDLTKQTFSKFK